MSQLTAFTALARLQTHQGSSKLGFRENICACTADLTYKHILLKSFLIKDLI